MRRLIRAHDDPQLPELRFEVRRGRVYDRRLLIVEDDVDLWPILERIARLVSADLQLEFVAHAAAATERMQGDQRYKAVLADVLLPGAHDGYALRPICARHQPWADFAMMSSSPKASGFDVQFLPKPFSISQARVFLHDLLS